MPTPITKKGYDALKAELDRLRKVERPQVIEAIAEARAHGDLSENAEYDAAKERQGITLSRMVFHGSNVGFWNAMPTRIGSAPTSRPDT